MLAIKTLIIDTIIINSESGIRVRENNLPIIYLTHI